MVKIAVTAGPDKLATLKRYLYWGVKYTGESFPTFWEERKLFVFEAESEYSAQSQADRFSSGLYGAKVLHSDEELERYKLEALGLPDAEIDEAMGA